MKNNELNPFWVGAFLGVVCFPLAVLYTLVLICMEKKDDVA